jgi:predicted N-acetyltransferase YhbS
MLEIPVELPAIRRIIAATIRPPTGGLVDLLRESDGYIAERSRVAVNGAQEAVGYVMFSRAELVGDNTWSVMALALRAVAERLQSSGIGSALVQEALSVADRRGEAAVIVLGHTSYIPRFGFSQARHLGIAAPRSWHLPDEVWMALPLATYRTGLRGTAVYPPAFAIIKSMPGWAPTEPSVASEVPDGSIPQIFSWGPEKLNCSPGSALARLVADGEGLSAGGPKADRASHRSSSSR